MKKKAEVKNSVVAITILFDTKTGKVIGKPKVYDAYNRYLGGIIKS